MNPFIPLTCEEVLAIKELSTYARTRVRLFGRLDICQSRRGIEFRTLQSLGEELESKVLIDFRCSKFEVEIFKRAIFTHFFVFIATSLKNWLSLRLARSFRF
jgi:hypothetical protein